MVSGDVTTVLPVESSPIEPGSGSSTLTAAPELAKFTVPRHTESTPDLQTGPSTLPTSSLLSPRDQESNGMWTILSQTVHLGTPFHNTDPETVSN